MTRRIWILTCFVICTACGQGGDSRSSPSSERSADAPDVPATTGPRSTADTVDVPESSASPPDTSHREPSNTIEAADDVLRRYYAALDEGDYRTAYEAWGESGRRGQTYDEFVSGYAETADVSVEIDGTPRSEGAAGSIYVTVPVVVRATLKNGALQLFGGTYTIRRVNDVPGATPTQLRWHIDRADLQSIR